MWTHSKRFLPATASEVSGSTMVYTALLFISAVTYRCIEVLGRRFIIQLSNAFIGSLSLPPKSHENESWLGLSTRSRLGGAVLSIHGTTGALVRRHPWIAELTCTVERKDRTRATLECEVSQIIFACDLL